MSNLPTSDRESDRKKAITGISLMIGGIFCLAAMDAAVRWLLKNDMSAVHLIAVRGWIILVVMLAWISRRAGLAALATRRPLHHLLRAMAGMLAPLGFFVALKTVPLAEATAVFFCSVFLLTIGSSLFFKEQVGVHRWAAVIVGFIGVLIVTRPGGESFQPEILLVLMASVSYSVLILMGRWMSSTETTFSLVFSYNLVVTVGFSLLLPWFWQSMSVQQVGLIVVISALALTGYFLLTSAFSTAPVSVVAPFEYSALAWAAVFGYVIWGEVLGLGSVAGIFLIVISGLYIAWRENRAAR